MPKTVEIEIFNWTHTNTYPWCLISDAGCNERNKAPAKYSRKCINNKTINMFPMQMAKCRMNTNGRGIFPQGKHTGQSPWQQQKKKHRNWNYWNLLKLQRLLAGSRFDMQANGLLTSTFHDSSVYYWNQNWVSGLQGAASVVTLCSLGNIGASWKNNEGGGEGSKRRRFV